MCYALNIHKERSNEYSSRVSLENEPGQKMFALQQGPTHSYNSMISDFLEKNTHTTMFFVMLYV